ncbi:MAG TPA: aminomethyl-transferring glycine dehydrogenase subunit GcvPA [Actinomycetota bacterium]|nr:aminomethyl-transferring glycine dehydrogenase subunit GcvPA [Actinomycetota bacterium]
MDFTPHTPADVAAMLAVVGVDSVDALFAQIPEDVRLDRALDLPPGAAEAEVAGALLRLAARNRTVDELVCFAAGGVSDHYVPALVGGLAGRSEFATSYTPYQPELSQGVLQALFEFQTMIVELTGMEAANASLYDGATALAEAVAMTLTADRRTVLVSGGVDPRLVATLRTYSAGTGARVETWEVPAGHGAPDAIPGGTAAVVLQHPNVYGVLEDVRAAAAAAHEAGARLIQIFDPVSLGVLAPPGDLDADLAVGEGQPFGSQLQFGGPNLGLLACRMADVRKMPGRIVGETVDLDGRTGYVLTLQAREQHIRREKATSNICTNQTLMALAATIHLAWLGPEGLREQGERCAAAAAYAADRLAGVPGVTRRFPDAPIFRDVALVLPRDADEVIDRLVDRGFLAGVAHPQEPTTLIVGLTERRTRAEIDALADATAEVLAGVGIAG